MSAFVKTITLMLAAIFTAAVFATATAESLSAEQERRYHDLLNELRCLVCQNQSLADSNAELAGDLRDVVLRMIQEGERDEEIFSFMTERYGNFVRYQPPFNWATSALWTAPFILLLLVLLSLYVYVKRRVQGDSRL